MNSLQKLIGYNHKEFLNAPLQVIEGKVPNNLRGTLYRSTSMMLKRQNGLPGHLFDGDGAILKVEFSNEEALGSYQFIKSEQYLREQAADSYIYSGLARVPSGNVFQRIWGAFNSKNPGNTSVLPLKNHLLALWEGGLPTSIEKTTLNTIGLSLCGTLNQSQRFSAHPKVCPKTQRIFNIGLEYGRKTEIHIYEMESNGQVVRQTRQEIQGVFFVHDFVLAGDYLVIPIYPNFIKSMKDVFLGRVAIGQDIEYRPDLGTQVLVIDTKTMTVIGNSINRDSEYAWHYSNGFVKNNQIIIEQATYRDFDSYKALFTENILKGLQEQDFKTIHERITISLQGRIVNRELLHNDRVEFLTIDDNDVGQEWDTTYGCIAEGSFFNGIVRYKKNDSKYRFYGNQNLVSEPIYVQNDKSAKGVGWLIFTKFDGQQATVEIIDSDNLETQCTLKLPEVPGTSFHGKFEKIQQ